MWGANGTGAVASGLNACLLRDPVNACQNEWSKPASLQKHLLAGLTAGRPDLGSGSEPCSRFHSLRIGGPAPDRVSGPGRESKRWAAVELGGAGEAPSRRRKDGANKGGGGGPGLERQPDESLQTHSERKVSGVRSTCPSAQIDRRPLLRIICPSARIYP